MSLPEGLIRSLKMVAEHNTWNAQGIEDYIEAVIADRDDTAKRLGDCQMTIATMTTALEQALQALTVTANESASGTRTAAAVRAKAKRSIRVALGKAAFDGITR